MRSLTNKADYAVRAVLEIARHHPEMRTTRQITASMDLPRNFSSQILATLVRDELLKSTAGPAGGYTLARPPTDITLLHVIELIEGPLLVDECILGGGSCQWVKVCPLHQPWSEANRAFADHLAATNFGELAEVDAAIRAGSYKLPKHTPPHSASPPRKGVADD